MTKLSVTPVLTNAYASYQPRATVGATIQPTEDADPPAEYPLFSFFNGKNLYTFEVAMGFDVDIPAGARICGAALGLTPSRTTTPLPGTLRITARLPETRSLNMDQPFYFQNHAEVWMEVDDDMGNPLHTPNQPVGATFVYNTSTLNYPGDDVRWAQLVRIVDQGPGTFTMADIRVTTQIGLGTPGTIRFDVYRPVPGQPTTSTPQGYVPPKEEDMELIGQTPTVALADLPTAKTTNTFTLNSPQPEVSFDEYLVVVAHQEGVTGILTQTFTVFGAVNAGYTFADSLPYMAYYSATGGDKILSDRPFGKAANINASSEESWATLNPNGFGVVVSEAIPAPDFLLNTPQAYGDFYGDLLPILVPGGLSYEFPLSALIQQVVDAPGYDRRRGLQLTLVADDWFATPQAWIHASPPDILTPGLWVCYETWGTEKNPPDVSWDQEADTAASWAAQADTAASWSQDADEAATWNQETDVPATWTQDPEEDC